MACRISELVLDCRDPETLAHTKYWCEVLDFVVLGASRAPDMGIHSPGRCHPHTRRARL